MVFNELWIVQLGKAARLDNPVPLQSIPQYPEVLPNIEAERIIS
jgi:hypothetical protein